MTRTVESSWRRRLVGHVQTRLWLVSALLMLLVAAYVIVGRQLMLLTPEFRQPLQEMLEQRLQAPLEIHALRGHMDGLSPVFVLEDLRLPAAGDGKALAIEHVALTVDLLPSLVQGTLRFRQLLVRGVELHAIRDESGQWTLRGLEGLAADRPREPDAVLRRLLDIFYRQNRLVLDQVRLTLEWPGLPTLTTRDLEMTLVNSGNRHKLAMRLMTTDRQRELDLRLSLSGDAYRLSDVNGELYARLKGPGWEKWTKPLWPFPVTPQSVDGEMVVWSGVRSGRLDSATLRLALDRLALRDERDGSQWPVTGAFALAQLDARDDGYLLSLSDLNLATPEGQWQAGEAGVWWNGERGERLAWRLLGRRFDISDSRDQLLAMPFTLPQAFSSLRDEIADLSPTGQVEALYVGGGADGLEAFSGRVANVGNQPRERIPGVSGLGGWFNGTPASGVAMLDTPELGLDMPRLYDHPLVFGIAGPVRWYRDGDVLMLETGRVRAANPDASGDALAGVRLAPGEMPELRLLADVHDGNGAAVAGYIPGNKLAPGLADWLNNAFVDGQVPRGRFLYQGPVKIDPARQQDRTLQMGFAIRDFQLHYLDGWPTISGLSGRVRLDGRRVEARDLAGRLLQTDFRQLSLDVPPVSPGDVPELIVAGQLQGPAGDLSRIFSDTPLREKLPAELQKWQLSEGQLAGHLLLRWPLGEGPEEPRLLASGRLQGATLASAAREITATDLSAPFAYDLRKGIEIGSFSGRLFDEPVTGSVSTGKGVTRVDLDGAMGVPRLREWLRADGLAPLSGRFDYDARLSLPWNGEPVVLAVESPLTGAGVELPAPLGKNAEAEVPSRLRWTLSSPAELFLRYGDRLAGRLSMTGEGVERGHVVLGKGEPGTAGEPGVLVTGELEQLSVAPWLAFLRQQQGGGADWPLRKLWLNLDRLDLYGVEVADAGLTVQPLESDWSVELESESLAGRLRVPEGYQPRGEEPLAVTVKRLRLQLEPGQGDALSPRDIPGADINLESAEINGVDYGNWRARLRPLDNGIRFASLGGAWRYLRFNGRLDWTETETGQQSHYVGSVHSGSMEKTLKAWEMEPVLEADDARGVLDLSWPGTPFDVDYTSMNGSVSVDVEDGRIPETSRSAEAMRVLGILNVGSLSRRLRLDFSDLYKKGLSFDSINGDFSVEGPVLTTRNLVIQSPSAEFRIRGQMNIEDETLDHHMEVTLPVSSNLYAGCLAGPAACAGIFVFDRLWGNRLEKMTSLGYRVTGTWDNPKVEEASEGVERE